VASRVVLFPAVRRGVRFGGVVQVPSLTRCVAHVDSPADEPRVEDGIEPGTPGASSRREFERRRARREQRIRDRHPKLGWLIQTAN